MKDARQLTDDELSAELDNLGKQWDEFRKDAEGAGSPGEWMIERMDEIRTEQRRRDEYQAMHGSR
jgi:hypothetical protein